MVYILVDSLQLFNHMLYDLWEFSWNSQENSDLYLKIVLSYFSTKTYVVGTQKNHLSEMVLLDTKHMFKLMHAYQTMECSTSGWVLKTTALWRK